MVHVSTRPAVAIVGASGSIGAGTVKKFLDEGWRVEGFDLLPATVEENEYYRHTVGDFRDGETVDEFVRRAAGVRHLVVIAGGAVDEEVACSDFVELSDEVISSSFGVNFFGVVRTVQGFLPLLREAAAEGDDVSVCLTGSVNAYQGIGIPAYSAAKAALRSLVGNLSVSEGKRGVRVNIVSPGTVITERTVKLYEGRDEHFAKLEGTTTIGRLSSVEDVAEAFFFLSSNRSVSGQEIIVDAGQLATGFRVIHSFD